MIANKHIMKIAAILVSIAVVLCMLAMVFSEKLLSKTDIGAYNAEYETKLFDTSEIITLDIIMDESKWNEMLENATSEVYYECDAVINGTTFSSVGIRPKGNTSLSSIASDPDNNRYSFKLEFDRFVSGQTCFGLDKLILNNNYADTTNMKEAIIYDMFKYIDADASLYNYAKISVNGEYWGLYLALEAVEESFMLRNYGTQRGYLYKPDSMNMGNRDGEQGGGMPRPENMENMPDFENRGGNRFNRGENPNITPPGSQTNKNAPASEMPIPETEEVPAEGGNSSNEVAPAMPDFNGEMQKGNPFGEGGSDGGGPFGGGGGPGSSGGGNLNYSDDELTSYSTIWDGAVTDSTDTDHKRVVTALKNISEKTNLETYMDTDNLLKYMAVHSFAVNDDSLSGSMAHNYYLYESDGKLNIIPWDYNLAFGGMRSTDTSSVVNDPIDSPFSATQFFDGLLEDEEYKARYHEYYNTLIEEYLYGGKFEETYNRIRSQIDELVRDDPNAMYTYEEYTEGVEMLYKTVMRRAESIKGQLAGTIPSTDEAQRQDSTNLTDSSDIDISVMGEFMGGGPGGGRGAMHEEFGGNFKGSQNSDGSAEENIQPHEKPDETAQVNAAEQSSEISSPHGQVPRGNMPQGQMPGGDMVQAQSPDIAFSQEQTDKTDTQNENAAGENSTQNTIMPENFDPSQFDGRAPFEAGASNSDNTAKNLIYCAICIVILLLALLFVKLFRRR